MPICTVRMERPNHKVIFHPLSGLWVKLWCDVSTGDCQFQAPHGGKWRNRGKMRDISKKNLCMCVCVCMWWVFLVCFGLGFCLCVCVHVWGFFTPLQSSACKWASFSYMCLFQALLLFHTGINLGADQAVEPTFIHSFIQGWTALPSLLTLSPDTEEVPCPHASQLHGSLLLGTRKNSYN